MKPKVTISHIKQLNGHRAHEYAMKAKLSLHDSGYYETQALTNWDHEAILACDSAGDIRGILVFQDTKWAAAIFVTIGYVDPDSRECGVYRRMWERLVLIAKERNVPWIVGATHPNNIQMKNVMSAFGRKPFRVMYEYQVSPGRQHEPKQTHKEK